MAAKSARKGPIEIFVRKREIFVENLFSRIYLNCFDKKNEGKET